MKKTAIILIGMPAVGKSTVGRLLAEKLAFDFYDLDKVICEKHHKSIQVLVDELGDEGFIKMEEAEMLNLPQDQVIIAPGGSLIFNDELMNSLKVCAEIVYLEDSFDNISARIPDLQTRGIVGLKTQSLKELYDLRTPLYKAHATLSVTCANKSWEQIADTIIQRL